MIRLESDGYWRDALGEAYGANNYELMSAIILEYEVTVEYLRELIGKLNEGATTIWLPGT